MVEQDLTDLRFRVKSVEDDVKDMPSRLAALEVEMKANNAMHATISGQLTEILSKQAQQTGAQRVLTWIAGVVAIVFGAGAGVAFERISGVSH